MVAIIPLRVKILTTESASNYTLPSITYREKLAIEKKIKYS
jgi:hypothetical protein